MIIFLNSFLLPDRYAGNIIFADDRCQEMVRRQKGRLLDAAGCLSDYDRDIADMARLAEDARRKAKSRKSPL